MKTEFKKRKERRVAYLVINILALALYLLTMRTTVFGQVNTDDVKLISYGFISFVVLLWLVSVALSRCPKCKKRIETRNNFVECPKCRARFD